VKKNEFSSQQVDL